MKLSQTNFTAHRFFLFPLFIMLSGVLLSASSAAAQPNISISGSASPSKIARGRSAQVTVVMEIPNGYHVHSNKPLEKFLIATQLQAEAPNGVRVGPVTYPRALLRSLKFSKNKVAVYEGRLVMRFSVTVPRNFTGNSAEIKARVRYQSCNDEACFPPQTKEVKIWLKIE